MLLAMNKKSKKFIELEDRARSLVIKVEQAMKETLQLEKDIEEALSDKECEELKNLLDTRFTELGEKFDREFK